MLANRSAQTIAQRIAVNSVVTAPRAIPEFHARQMQLAGKLDMEQIAGCDLVRCFSWPAHGPLARCHHAQSPFLLGHCGCSLSAARANPPTQLGEDPH